jgi:hypothetical protein
MNRGDTRFSTINKKTKKAKSSILYNLKTYLARDNIIPMAFEIACSVANPGEVTTNRRLGTQELIFAKKEKRGKMRGRKVGDMRGRKVGDMHSPIQLSCH